MTCLKVHDTNLKKVTRHKSSISTGIDSRHPTIIPIHTSAYNYSLQPNLTMVLVLILKSHVYTKCLQCFDTVGWAAGKASGL